MNLKEKLQTLLRVMSRRQVGNTTLMKVGTDKYERPFLLLSHKLDFSKYVLDGSENGKAVSMQSVEKAILANDVPVAIDHVVIQQALEESLAIVEKYEDAAKIIPDLMKLTEYFQQRTHDLESLSMKRQMCAPWDFSRKRQLDKEILDLIELSYEKKEAETMFHKIMLGIK